MTHERIAAALFGVGLQIVALAAGAGSFVAIKAPDCINGPYFPGWTVGGQYLDANNGVYLDQYTMLARWQGNDILTNWVTYNMGAFTGLTTSSQRGRIPQDPYGSPGAQVTCTKFGMFINTWETPHRPIVGGSYNDMFGYAWSSNNKPRPFVDPSTGKATDLVLQSMLAVTEFNWNPNRTTTPSIGQLSFFAYLRDTTHPTLHPIAVLAGVAASNWSTSWFNGGYLSYDYSNADTVSAVAQFPAWFQRGQTGSGVWFVSGPISNSSPNPYVTTVYSAGQNNSALQTYWNASVPLQFWRAHITPQNLTRISTDINASTQCIVTGCPLRGYSTRPQDYVLEYAGVIMEVAIGSDIPLAAGSYDSSPSNWIDSDHAKDQVSMAMHGDEFGVFRYVP